MPKLVVIKVLQGVWVFSFLFLLLPPKKVKTEKGEKYDNKLRR